MRRRRGEAGFGLMLLIALIAVSSLLISATSLAFVANARALQLRVDRVKAYYLAQAGVMQAIQDWRDSSNSLLNRRWTPLNATVTGNQIFKAGQSMSDFALHSPNAGQWILPTRLRRWRVTNIRTGGSGSAITVTRARITWTPSGAARLVTMRLNNNAVVPAVFGGYASGTEIALSGSTASRTLNAGGNWSGNNTYLQWNVAPPNPVAVTIQWTFSDDSATKHSKSHVITLWNGAKAGAAPSVQTFSVTSTGQVNQALLRTLRTVRAVVSAAVGSNAFEIIDWDDVEKNQP